MSPVILGKTLCGTRTGQRLLPHGILDCLLRGALMNTKPLLLPGLLRHHPEGPNSTYRHVDEPIAPRATEIVKDWIVIRFGS